MSLDVAFYAPGTETCSFIAATPNLTGFPGYVLPFPSIGARQTEFGTDGAAHPLWHDAARNVTYMRGAIAHQPERPRVHKLFAYRNGQLTLLSTSMVGNDSAARPFVADGSTFFAANACGGMVDFDRGTSGFSCSRLVRYTP